MVRSTKNSNHAAQRAEEQAMSNPFESFEIISTYTRAQAIEDGVLVDVTEWASADKGFHGGFTLPVALTRALWNAIELIPASQSHQDIRGRAHDVLWMASLAARGHRGASDVLFRVHLRYRGTRKSLQVLRVSISGGDAGEPVITIGFPEDF